MEDTTVTVIGIMLASLIMFVVPLMLIADRSDDISQLISQTVTAEFVDEVVKTGRITAEEYQKFISGLQSSGNNYDVDIELKILDENISKVVTDNDYSKIGNNAYYSIFTSQIEEKIGISGRDLQNSDGKLVLKQGDEIAVTVKNSSATLSQALKSFYYNSTGSDLHIIVATAAGTIAINGSGVR